MERLRPLAVISPAGKRVVPSAGEAYDARVVRSKSAFRFGSNALRATKEKQIG